MADLNAIHQYLGIVGSFGNISTLHHQQVLQRTIVPSQSARLHLVWFDRTIFIKPLPDCLLNAAYIDDVVRPSKELYGLATGFLYSYCRLIQTPLDLELAKKLNLVNEGITWETWYNFRARAVSSIQAMDMNQRWKYGELRLDRLNLVWGFTGRGFTYFTVHREYGTYFEQYFKLFITIFALVAIILQSMQVIVTTKETSKAWINISYGFSFATLLAVVACLGYVLSAFILMVVYNAAITMMAHHKVSRRKRKKAKGHAGHRNSNQSNSTAQSSGSQV